MKKTFLAIALSSLLIGCGGSDNKKTEQTPQLKTGVLIDGPIAGATYTINGVEKTTNNDGEFEYQDGDEIIFKIGGIEIGRVQAAPRITPLDLADDENKRINLMIFLQSLDENSDHDDGIKIPDGFIFDLKGANIDFSLASDEFVQKFQPILNDQEEFSDKTVVSPEIAKQNFTKNLLKDLAGVWLLENYDSTDESIIVLKINDQGEYMLGEVVLEEEDIEFSGVEMGELNINPLNYAINATATIDTNEDWGLADGDESTPLKLSFDGTVLKITEIDNPEFFANLVRIPQNSNSIVGAWSTESGRQLFTFHNNGTFMMVDTIGDEATNPCGGPGLEYGKYRVVSNKLFIDSISHNTNGCAGFSDNNAHLGLTIQLSAQSLSFTVSSEGSFTLTRDQ